MEIQTWRRILVKEYQWALTSDLGSRPGNQLYKIGWSRLPACAPQAWGKPPSQQPASNSPRRAPIFGVPLELWRGSAVQPHKFNAAWGSRDSMQPTYISRRRRSRGHRPLEPACQIILSREDRLFKGHYLTDANTRKNLQQSSTSGQQGSNTGIISCSFPP